MTIHLTHDRCGYEDLIKLLLDGGVSGLELSARDCHHIREMLEGYAPPRPNVCRECGGETDE